MKRITIMMSAAGVLAFGATAVSAQEDAVSLDELLNLIEQGQSRDSQEARQREAEFAQRRTEQQQLLNQARGERTRLERESARLEQLFGARAMKQEDKADVKPTGISHVVFGDCLKPSHQARVGIVQLE